MSLSRDIGIFRMRIFSLMHFDSSIHIFMISLGRFMRRFVRWIGYGGTHSRRMMDGVFGDVPFSILIRSERSWILRMDDRSMDLGDGGFSRIRWGMIVWDIGPQNGFGMQRRGNGIFWDVRTQNGFRG